MYDFFPKSISLQVPKGQLIGIVGTVGCGKSSLLAALMGEMVMPKGELRVNVRQISEKQRAQNIGLLYIEFRERVITDLLAGFRGFRITTSVDSEPKFERQHLVHQ